MNGDDIKWSNSSMPVFPKGMKLRHRIMCLFGYHLSETRQTAKGHCYGVQTEEGARKGIFGLHDENPMELRSQCGRCGTLL